MHPSMLLCLTALNQQPVAITWPLQGLNSELNFIAFAESNYGKYLNHAPHPRGPFDTAFGSLGLKPSTAHDIYIKSPRLRVRFPGLEDKATFLNRFWRDATLYMYCANWYWYSLRKNTPSLARAVYSWRWGLTASTKVSDIMISVDPYVIKYAGMASAK